MYNWRFVCFVLKISNLAVSLEQGFLTGEFPLGGNFDMPGRKFISGEKFKGESGPNNNQRLMDCIFHCDFMSMFATYVRVCVV